MTTELSDDNICSICLNDLNIEQIYTLPECNHKFHTNCITSWFRTGHNKCPCCNNEGLNGGGDGGWGRLSTENKIKYFKSLSRKKNATKELKKHIEILKYKEKKVTDIIEEIKQYDNTNKGTYNELIKPRMKLLSKKFRLKHIVRHYMWKICDTTNICPLIIVKKKIIKNNIII